MAKTENAETTKEVEVKMISVKLIKNIKYGDKTYSTGKKIEIKEDDYKEFKDAEVILVEENEKENKEEDDSNIENE